MPKTIQRELEEASELLIDNLSGAALVSAMSATTREGVIKALDIKEIYKHREDELRRIVHDEDN